MRDLNVYVEIAKRQLDAIDVPYSKDIREFTINKRRMNNWGQCTRKRDSRGYFYTISINSSLLDERIKEEALLDTIIHELLHTIDGAWNDDHKGKWLYWANIVNDCYSCYNIKRGSSTEEIGMTQDMLENRYKYIIECENCGHKHYNNRMSGILYNPQRYRCGVCGTVGKWRGVKGIQFGGVYNFF